MWKKKPIKERNKPFVKRIFFPVAILVAWIALGVFSYQLVERVFLQKQLFVSPVPISFSKTQLFSDGSSFLTTKAIETLLKKNDIAFESVYYMQDQTYVVVLPEGGEVVLSANKSFEEQISSLQLISSRLTIEGKRFSRLDFRFNKPVITLQE